MKKVDVVVGVEVDVSASVAIVKQFDIVPWTNLGELQNVKWTNIGVLDVEWHGLSLKRVTQRWNPRRLNNTSSRP
jgi:hypothetical protein